MLQVIKFQENSHHKPYDLRVKLLVCYQGKLFQFFFFFSYSITFRLYLHPCKQDIFWYNTYKCGLHINLPFLSHEGFLPYDLILLVFSLRDFLINQLPATIFVGGGKWKKKKVIYFSLPKQTNKQTNKNRKK